MATNKLEVLAPPKLGEVWKGQGGILGALVRGINGEPDYYLIVPCAKKIILPYGGYGEDEPGANCGYDGAANTAALVASKIGHPAAEFCASFKFEGHADYYLPARREFRALWCTVPELFEDGWNWTSTQFSAYNAWFQSFGYGLQHYNGKDHQGRVQPVRRLLAIQ